MYRHEVALVGAGRRAGPRWVAPAGIAIQRGRSLSFAAGNHGGIAPTQRRPMCCGGATAQLASARVRCPCTTEQGSADAIWCLILPMRCSSALARCPSAAEECCAGTIGCSIHPCAVFFCACGVSLCHRRVLRRRDRVFDSPMCGVLLRLWGVLVPQKSVAPTRSGVRFTHVRCLAALVRCHGIPTRTIRWRYCTHGRTERCVRIDDRLASKFICFSDAVDVL